MEILSCNERTFRYYIYEKVSSPNQDWENEHGKRIRIEAVHRFTDSLFLIHS